MNYFLSLARYSLITGGTCLMASALAWGTPETAPRLIGGLDVDSIMTAPSQVSLTVRLNASPSRIYDFITDSSTIPEWVAPVSMVREVNPRPGNKVGLVLEMALKNGNTIRETVVHSDPPRLYAYQFEENNPFGISDHATVWEVKPIKDERGCDLSWTQYFNHPEPDKAAENMRTIMRKSLDALARRFGGQVSSVESGPSTSAARQARAGNG